MRCRFCPRAENLGSWSLFHRTKRQTAPSFAPQLPEGGQGRCYPWQAGGNRNGALVILGAMALAAPLVAHLAMPALAGLLVITAWTMSEPQRRLDRLRAPSADRFLRFLTMALTLLADLTVAIALGTAIRLALRLARRDAPPAHSTPPEC